MKEKHDIVKLTGVKEMGWLNQVVFVHKSHKGLQYLNLLNSYTKLKSFQISLLVVEIFIVVVVGTG